MHIQDINYRCLWMAVIVSISAMTASGTERCRIVMTGEQRHEKGQTIGRRPCAHGLTGFPL
jgi:hypothetical protein